MVLLCGLTFELRGRRREGDWPARRMIDSERLAGQAACRWRSPLERRVRPHLVTAELDLAKEVATWACLDVLEFR